MSNSAIHWNLAIDENFNSEKWEQIRTTIYETIRAITKDSMLSVIYSEKLLEFHSLIKALNRNDKYSQFLLDECNRFMNELDLERISQESKTLYEAVMLIKTYRKDVD